MRKFVELECPAIWRPVRNNEMSIRPYAGAYPYVKRGVYGQSSPLDPVVRYAKNFTKGKIDFSIVLFTRETNHKKVDEFMNKIVKKIKVSEIKDALSVATSSNMNFLDTYYDKETA